MDISNINIHYSVYNFHSVQLCCKKKYDRYCKTTMSFKRVATRGNTEDS